MGTQIKEPKREDIKALIEKIVVNVGIGKRSSEASFKDKAADQVTQDLATITGQKPQPRPARKSIASFKSREGQTVGLKVTLRGKKMIDFFERLVRIVLPRVRDFRGISKTSIDQRGTLNIGFREQLVFPEINPEKSTYIFSLGVNIVSKDKGREKAEVIFEKLGIPFVKDK